MNEEWFLNIGSERVGPITFEELRNRLLAMGEVPDNTLVWSASTVEWVHPRDVPNLLTPPAEGERESANPAPVPQSTASTPAPTATSSSSSGEGFNPYTAPSAPLETSLGTSTPQEAGFYKLELGTCINGAWHIMTTRPTMPIVFFLIFFAVVFATQVPLQTLLVMYGTPEEGTGTPTQILTELGLNIVSQIISTFFGLGAVLFGINFVQQRQEASFANLFQGGPFLLTGILSGILMFILIFCAIIVTAIPLLGITYFLANPGGNNWEVLLIPFLIAYILALTFVAVRFGQYQYLIVAEKAGPVECLKLSWQLTRGNVLPIIFLGIVTFGIVMLGVLAFLVGLVFALPLVYIMWVCAFQLMRYGPNSIPQ